MINSVLKQICEVGKVALTHFKLLFVQPDWIERIQSVLCQRNYDCMTTTFGVQWNECIGKKTLIKEKQELSC